MAKRDGAKQQYKTQLKEQKQKRTSLDHVALLLVVWPLQHPIRIYSTIQRKGQDEAGSEIRVSCRFDLEQYFT